MTKLRRVDEATSSELRWILERYLYWRLVGAILVIARVTDSAKPRGVRIDPKITVSSLESPTRPAREASEQQGSRVVLPACDELELGAQVLRPDLAVRDDLTARSLQGNAEGALPCCLYECVERLQ